MRDCNMNNSLKRANGRHGNTHMVQAGPCFGAAFSFETINRIDCYCTTAVDH
jgi:hypothetical protein